MYQVLQLTAAVTVSVPITHPGLLAVPVSVASVQSSELLLGPVFATKAAT